MKKTKISQKVTPKNFGSSEFNNKYKDSVFCKLCEDKKNLVNIFEDLCPDYKDVKPEDIELLKVYSVLTNGIYNDVSFLYKDCLYIFIEIQSTWNYNMAFRLGEYVFKALGQFVEKRKLNRYASSPIKLPTPKLFVVFTGKKENVPEYVSLREQNFGLSSDFSFDSDSPFSVEVRAKIIYNKSEDWAGNSILAQYMKLIRIVENLLDKSQKDDISYAERVIKICHRLGVLSDFFEEHEVFIMNLVNRAYEERKFIELTRMEEFNKGRSEGFEKGLAEGLAEGLEKEKEASIKMMLAENLSFSLIARISRSSVEFVEELAKKFSEENSVTPSV